ncbi:hypothetical protein [Listeria grayi]|uniref:hypothetical protein n=1 Tax=Listeria grayi TaxID=1641 RepID=UPI0016269C0A|nr:hypothetical protein [Listeria grayi]MBC1922824.1 GNAT family N-acetyltransferase [Listeria grayi]
MNTRIITSRKEKMKLFKKRFDVFVLKDQDAPGYLYPDGYLVDKCDTKGLHVGCFEGKNLLGFLTVILKKNCEKLPIEMRHEIVADYSSAEIMRLVISDEFVSKKELAKRGKILQNLLGMVEKIVKDQQLKTLYLVTTREAQSMYERIGFIQIGTYKMYENISYECPMRMELKTVKI